ncbi:MAG: ABC transporter substrate-binding protein [Marinobacter sp.]|uniref:ABC transporter substrate-binding protein n=1 Tax=Marinobacter sp. TaxID=50741 RepID=UPI00299D694E|nr:ABC transporter substrate-binding protein [Marinobacter sp.]MDX1754585.1 ABC transporter substrate-binding protein [Marinobacter sp.]
MSRICLTALLLLLPTFCWAFSVTFINPGKHDEPYWLDAANGMKAAARSLDIELEILFAGRDPLRQIELTREVAARSAAHRPDYLMFSVEKGTFAEQMRIADAAGIRVFLAYNGLLPAERSRFGGPREQFSGLLGSLIPVAESAGQLTAMALLLEARQRGLYGADGKIHMIAISGDRSTDSSIRRNRGMQSVVEANDDLVLHQLVHADWRQDKGRLKAARLMDRYPEVSLIWCGNDLIAFGAIEAVRERQLRPGVEVLVSGVNTSKEAMNRLINGELSALAGGHFMAGAWSLVLLYDYHHGIDFADSEGLELERPMFSLFTPELASRYLERFAEPVPQIDFTRYSKHRNPGLRRYRFDFGQLLEP